MNRYLLCSDAARGWWIEDAITTEIVAGPTWTISDLEQYATEHGIRIPQRTSAA